MLKVVLVNPPSPFLLNQKANPPLGLLYVAAFLQEKGHDVSIIDLAGKEANAICLGFPKANLYGITATTPQYPSALLIKNVIKRKFPRIPVMLGGHHASSMFGACADDGFDIVIRGEGESTSVVAASGLFFLDLWRPSIKNIDSLPMPAWDLIDIKSYGYSFGHGPAASLTTSRGCPWNLCKFCASNIVFPPPVRLHSPARVLREVESLMDYGFTAFQFLDDAFTESASRLEAICELFKPLEIKWRCYSRSGIHKRYLEKMHEAGCVEIGFGAESGSQEILDRVCKGTTVEEYAYFVQDCKDVGIVVQAFMMVGLPGETLETVQQTRDWFMKALPDKFGLNIFLPLPGSPIYTQPGKYGVRIRRVPFDQMYAKGLSPEDIKSTVATEKMDFDEVKEAYLYLMKEFSQATGFVPGVNNG